MDYLINPHIGKGTCGLANGREATGVACVVVGIWDLGGFEVGAAGN